MINTNLLYGIGINIVLTNVSIYNKANRNTMQFTFEYSSLNDATNVPTQKGKQFNIKIHFARY